MINRFLCRVALVTLALVGASAASHARQPYIDINADIGPLAPVALGENINLSPCGSEVTTTNSSTIVSICNTIHPDEWSINYLVSFGGITSALTFGTGGDGVPGSISSLVSGAGGVVQAMGSAAVGLGTASIATGAGTLFSTAGTYVISLITAVNNDAILTGVNGRPGRDGGLLISDSGLTVNGATVGNFDGTTIGTLDFISGGNPAAGNGRRNVAFAQATLVITEAITVPEPSTLLMLLLALVVMGRFQMRGQFAAS